MNRNAYRKSQVDTARAIRRLNVATVPHMIGYRAKLRFLAAIRETLAPALATLQKGQALMDGIGSSVGFFEYADRNYGGAGGRGLPVYNVSGSAELPAAYVSRATVETSGSADRNVTGAE